MITCLQCTRWAMFGYVRDIRMWNPYESRNGFVGRICCQSHGFPDLEDDPSWPWPGHGFRTDLLLKKSQQRAIFRILGCFRSSALFWMSTSSCIFRRSMNQHMLAISKDVTVHFGERSRLGDQVMKFTGDGAQMDNHFESLQGGKLTGLMVWMMKWRFPFL